VVTQHLERTLIITEEIYGVKWRNFKLVLLARMYMRLLGEFRAKGQREAPIPMGAPLEHVPTARAG
jgi:hypothetical protein